MSKKIKNIFVQVHKALYRHVSVCMYKQNNILSLNNYWYLIANFVSIRLLNQTGRNINELCRIEL